MNVAFIGTHGTGKSKLSRLLASILQNKGYDVTLISDITRSLNSIGIPINEAGNIITQILCFSEYYKKVILPIRRPEEIIICDRSLFDDLAYIEESNILEKDKEIISNIILRVLDNFWDIIFYMEPKYEMIPDNIRSNNKLYYTKIDETINNKVLPLIKKYSKNTLIHKISSYGFEKEREETVLVLLNNPNKKQAL